MTSSAIDHKAQGLPSVVMPGDVIASSLPVHGVVRLGSGVDIAERHVEQNNLIDSNEIPSSDHGMRGSRLIATEVGLLSAGEDNKSNSKITGAPEVISYSVMAVHKKKYTHPRVGDAVIGTVLSQVGGEYYEIDIHSMTTALLPVLAFDNATKRNRPMLKAGDVVYGSVKVVDGMERILLDCTNSGSSTGFGPLHQSTNSLTSGGKGMLFRITPAYSQYLLKSSNTSRDSMSILHVLGSRIPFEIVIGMNGVFWLSSSSGDVSGSKGDGFMETCILGATIQACETVVGEAGDALSRRVLRVLAHHVAKKS